MIIRYFNTGLDAEQPGLVASQFSGKLVGVVFGVADAVFAQFFDLAHQLVGFFDQVIDRFRSPDAGQDANTEGHLEIMTAHDLIKLIAQFLGNDLRFRPGGFGEKDRKLVTPQPRHRVGRPQMQPEAIDHQAEDLVADRLASAFIENLEVVQIEIQEGERPPVPGQAVDFHLDQVEKEPPGDRLGQIVGAVVGSFFV